MKAVTLLATRATIVAEVNTDTNTLPKLYVKELSNLSLPIESFNIARKWVQ